ncbi:MAG TPA: DNA methyltransferase, partial [Polyangia bacterium]|nr:DNA methyltransferase [Polyangia bacterium]
MTINAEAIQATFSGHLQKPITVREIGPENNRVRVEDRAIHDWYRFVLSFPPHLVRDYLQRFGLSEGSCVLDPFCGTGTTLVECKRHNVNSVGLEANPMPWFATNTKIDWRPHPDALLKHAEKVADTAEEILIKDGIPDFLGLPLFPDDCGVPELKKLPVEAAKLILANSISPLPLHKTLVLLEALEEHSDERFAAHERLALAKAIVSDISNLHFGPEVGIGKPKKDAAVIAAWLRRVTAMAHDMANLPDGDFGQANVYRADSRNTSAVLAPNSVDA